MSSRLTRLQVVLTAGERVAHHQLQVEGATWSGANVLESVQEQLGLQACLLRRLAFGFDEPSEDAVATESVWHLDALGPNALDWQAVDVLPPQVQVWAQLALKPASPRRPAWMRPGWRTEALAWLDAALGDLGWQRLGEPEVLKHLQISSMWRVRTSGGTVYFKAVPDFFEREVTFTPWLAREVPGAAPAVLAADFQRRFLLLADAGEVPTAPDPARLAAHLAWVQQASLPHLETLRALGLPDHGPEYVLSRLESLLKAAAQHVGEAGGLSSAELAALKTLRPRFEAALRRLAAGPVPRTLGHGDLHMGNLAECEGRFTLLDWSDVCSTHPFFDANFRALLYSGAPQVLAEAAERYLDCWSAYATPEVLRSLFDDAALTSELYRALGYVDGIQPHVEDGSEWSTAHLEHFRMLLNSDTESR